MTKRKGQNAKFWEEKYQIRRSGKSGQNVAAISMEQLIGLVYVVFIGYGCGFLSLLLEVF